MLLQKTQFWRSIEQNLGLTLRWVLSQCLHPVGEVFVSVEVPGVDVVITV